MPDPVRYFHGGAPGLNVGDRITPHPPRQHPGCAECEARVAGRQIVLPDGRLSEPPTGRTGHVYLTTHRLYATFYASLAWLGDLYEVQPEGDVEASAEDYFPTIVATSAVVVRVLERAVRLTDAQRRRLDREWKAAETAVRRARLGIPRQLNRR